MARPRGTKYIETAEKMWKLFDEYRTKVKKNPILKHVFVGKDGDSKREELHRCLTMEGFENYVADLEIITDLGRYFQNKDGAYDDYGTICLRIRRHIRQDQIEGGMAGIYNSSITQRLNSLTDKSEVTVTEQPLFPDE